MLRSKLNLSRLAEIQIKYASLYRPGQYRRPKLIAGVDCSYRGELIACVGVVLSKEGEVLQTAQIKGRVFFPYISGFFAFREGPWLLALLRRFSLRPELLFVDGNGLLHPRKAGLAVFVGVRSGLPTVGISKKPTARAPWECGKRLLPLDGGFALCRKGWKRPVFISPGNLLSPEAALRTYEENSPAKIPTPIKMAHSLARRLLY